MRVRTNKIAGGQFFGLECRLDPLSHTDWGGYCGGRQGFCCGSFQRRSAARSSIARVPSHQRKSMAKAKPAVTPSDTKKPAESKKTPAASKPAAAKKAAEAKKSDQPKKAAETQQPVQPPQPVEAEKPKEADPHAAHHPIAPRPGDCRRDGLHPHALRPGGPASSPACFCS